ncbi:hypothetical protein CNN82_04155 [Pseudomonas frederiksbergensis]|uniref:Uncharacterized protein n=1 Tax=Pseudomonas frederiksbergensis TaxID=104087 RepID=A0AB33E531_9PSED|nr:hypothetical protein CNN82_04155 [Pseudomonas frederiksbergensis]
MSTPGGGDILVGQIIGLTNPHSNSKCTTRLVLRAIIEHNGGWRIDDFSSTAHHRHHIESGHDPMDSVTKDPEHHIKISKNGYTLMRSFNALFACSTDLTPDLVSIRTLRPLGRTVPLAE